MRHLDAPFGKIIGLFAGKVELLWDDRLQTAIRKKPVSGSVRLTEEGLEGDEQADREAHGGPDQAIHHYAADHIPFWLSEFPELADTLKPGCFGENVSTVGLDETNLCLGDVLTMGSATVQVRQGRQPCWKLDMYIGHSDIANAFVNTGKTGWYYRVLESGWVSTNDFMTVVSRPEPDWSIATVIAARFNAHLDLAVARALSELTHLSADWRAHFAARC